MKHVSEDDLILHYYGEGARRADVDTHLAGCELCATTYRDIADALVAVTMTEVPDRGEHYGLEVWQRIRHQLPERKRSWLGLTGWGTGDWGWGRRLAMAGTAAGLLVAAFAAGRYWPPQAGSAVPESTTVATSEPADERAPDRILLASVADHLERSERMLTDIMNAPDRGDISLQQAWAEDLLRTSRLYRQDAAAAGEQSVAMVLDELERNLIEIVHSPSQISAADLEQVRRRIDAAALLFKVRVMSDALRRRETPAAPEHRQPSTEKVS